MDTIAQRETAVSMFYYNKNVSYSYIQYNIIMLALRISEGD